MMNNNFTASILLTLGSLFLLGLAADLLGRHSPIPRVTLLLLCGFVIGPSGFDLLPGFTETLFPILTDIALTMVGFLLGQRLVTKNVARLGKQIFGLSVCVVLITALLVFTFLFILGSPIEIALLLAGIATATAPAATFDTVREIKAKGKFTDTLLGIVAIDDAWGLIVFSLLLAVVSAYLGNGNAIHFLQSSGWEIGGAVLLGSTLGVPLALIMGRVNAGKSIQAEALGIVLLCAGLATWLEVSYILAAIVMGAVISSMIQHRCALFHVVDQIEWPFLILFFLLAGASLHIGSLWQVGSIGMIYIIARVIGKFVGAYLGNKIIHSPPAKDKWMGLALTPQAGVAIGMALLAAQRFPELQAVILPVVLGSTVFFELLGPVATRWVLVHVGEANRSKQP